MSTKQKQNDTAVENKGKDNDAPGPRGDAAPTKNEALLVLEHLPPLPLVFVVLFCSGALWILGLRDAVATGKMILGEIDEAYLYFTKSTQWFDDSKGWKSTQGGLSAIQQITTDENNMGGLFVRKTLGFCIMAVHLHKLLPLLFHPSGAQWKRGDFRPLLKTALLSNVAIASLYVHYMSDLVNMGADGLPKLVLGLLGFETLVLFYYVLASRRVTRGPAVAMPEGKIPSSVVSRIVGRTVVLVSSAMMLIAGRDLLFPGYILEMIPSDDIYLEWTGALLHSPPADSPEAAEHGINAPFYIADKFLSQLLALHVVILCLYKFVSAFLIRYGSDGSGVVASKMIWKASALGGTTLVLAFRLFAPAAKSASLDLRWHLMCLAYETFVLGLYGFL